MRICFITKYPPIEGGVSRDCYWMARGLAEAGHTVHVVTNADEVEPHFRLYLSETDRAPGGRYAPRFEASGGSVQVHSTGPPDKQMYYIPQNNPSVSRLATIATDVIRREGCEIIFAYYLEPYGVAAYLASRWTGVPYVFQHAGSDLNRLMLLPELETGYREVLLAANRVLSAGPSAERLMTYGVSAERIRPPVRVPPPPDVFCSHAPPLDLEELLTQTVQHGLLEEPWEPNREPLDERVPLLGLYGKIGVYKGSFNLLWALAALAREGFRLYLIVMAHGWAEARFREVARRLEIADRIRILPFLPHWRVPEFIRRCTAVAFLERDFPISLHGPQIPTEVISCGTCLIVSREVALKQAYAARIRDGENAVVVSDPKQIYVLASRIRYALEDPGRAAEIGRRANQELRLELPRDLASRDMETILSQVVGERPVS